MDLTTLLSKVFGVYFLLVGGMMLLHHSFLKTVSKSLIETPALRFLIGALMLIGGVFLIISHQDWDTLPAAFISLLGWLTAFKAILYMNLSNNGVKKWVNWAYGIGYGWWGALLVIALGLYLSNFGYGWF